MKLTFASTCQSIHLLLENYQIQIILQNKASSW